MFEEQERSKPHNVLAVFHFLLFFICKQILLCIICWHVGMLYASTQHIVDHTCGYTSDYDNAVDGDVLPVWGWGKSFVFMVLLCCVAPPQFQ